MDFELIEKKEKSSRVLINTAKQLKNIWLHYENHKCIISWHGGCFAFALQDAEEDDSATNKKLLPLKLTMPGKVLAINVKPGDIVEVGKSLIIVEAMKMENNLLAESKAKIVKIYVNVGDRLETGTTLISFEEA